MTISIIIFTILIIFVYTYTVRLNDDQNKIKENLESYAQKKKAGEQKPKVQRRTNTKRKSYRKKKANVQSKN